MLQQQFAKDNKEKLFTQTTKFSTEVKKKERKGKVKAKKIPFKVYFFYGHFCVWNPKKKMKIVKQKFQSRFLFFFIWKLRKIHKYLKIE